MIVIKEQNEFQRKLVPIDEQGKEDFYNIYDYFSIKDPALTFTPRVQSGLSDGKKKFVQMNGNFLFGLKNRIISYMKNNNIEYEDQTKDEVEDVSLEEIEEFMKKLDLPFEPYDFQIYGVWVGIREKRKFLSACTGSGKSLIIYSIVRYLLSKNKKIMIVVPTTMLVDQMYSDFFEYYSQKEIKIKQQIEDSFGDTSQLEKELKQLRQNRKETNLEDFDSTFHKIYAGVEKYTDHSVVISTWQSIFDLDEDFFDVDALIFDEGHSIVSDSYAKISGKSRAEWRIAMSGTYPPSIINQLLLEGMIGGSKTVITSRQLIERGLATETIVQPIILTYNKDTIKEIKDGEEGKTRWVFEDQFVRLYEKRIDFISKFAQGISKTGNTIILFKNKDFGKALYEEISKTYENVEYIVGDTSKSYREAMRKSADGYNDLIIIASLKILSTGVNIKSLKNVVFAQVGKSEISVIQSIGRVLRLYDGKEKSIIYDIVDDFRYFTKTGKCHKPNYYWNHYLERLDSYAKYDYPVLESKRFKID